MVTDPELANLTDLKDCLKACVKERDGLQKQIKIENNNVNGKAEFPKAASSLFSLFSWEKPDLNKYAEWYQNYDRFMQDTNNRKMLKNLMPSLFGRITLHFSVDDSKPPVTKTEIACSMVGGERIDAHIIASSKATIIGRNDPGTKKQKPFRLTNNGERLPVKEAQGHEDAKTKQAVQASAPKDKSKASSEPDKAADKSKR